MAAKPRAVIVVAILAVAIALAAAVALYNYLKDKEAEVVKAREAAVATEKVVVAARGIPIGTTIESNQVKLAPWPKESMPPGAIKSIEAVTGRVALQSMLEGDAVTEPKLRPLEGPPGIMTYKIPEGHRAMTVAVDQVSGVAGFITPGSYVDVVLTATPPGRSQSVSRIIFQNVPVLATGQIIETKEGEPVIVPTVTLDVTPDDAEKMAAAVSQGQLRLLLRRTGDEEMSSTRGATVRQVLSGTRAPARRAAGGTVTRAPVAKRVVTGPHSVEVWRDGSKTVETFRVKKEAAK
jgi:pilus assembly protein CpaB